MPQDSLRSIVYRSFVTCDDPSGVVQCKTIRKSKTTSKGMEGKVENVKSQKNLVTSSLQKEGREELFSKRPIDEFERPMTSAHLKEVSRGAEKLSKVADSFSKRGFCKQSEDIAKDLLRGALSLQESLLMLGKLRDSSKDMGNLNKKRDEPVGGRPNRKSLQRSYSERFGGDHNNVLEFQKPRLSADGSSRDCYDELREVIRESFARQNLLSKGLSQERTFSKRKLDLSPDIASASSSQSSMFNSHDFASSDSSSSNLQSEKQRGSNVIARLMGLEEFPSKPVESTLQNHIKRDKLSENARPFFDIDFPNARKPSFIVEKVRPEQRTLEEIIEIMQFKGLIKSKSLEGSKPKMCHSKVSDFADDAPPIVLIKPQHNSGLERDSPCANKCTCTRKASQTEEMLNLWKIRETVPPKGNYPQKGGHRDADIHRKVKIEKNEVKRVSHERKTKDYGEATARPSVKECKIQDNQLSSVRTKTSVPVSSKLPKKEVIEKRVETIQKRAHNMRKAVKRNQVPESNSSRSTVSKANNPGKINTKKVSNSKEFTASRNKAALPKSNTSNPISTSHSTLMPHISANGKKIVKNEKPVNNQSAVAVENMGKVDIDDMMETETTPPEQFSCEEMQDVSGYCLKDESSTTCESMAQNCEAACENSNNIGVDTSFTPNESRTTKTSILDVLLSSASFISHAGELFDTSSRQPASLKQTSFSDHEMSDAKLILDCANELLQCKRQQQSLTTYPLLQHPIMRSKFSISFDLLVSGICDEIENLQSYNKLSDEILLIDNIYAMHATDLRGKAVFTGTWDLGWKNGFTQLEVERVVVDIEEQLFSAITEDLIFDFFSH